MARSLIKVRRLDFAIDQIPMVSRLLEEGRPMFAPGCVSQFERSAEDLGEDIPTQPPDPK